jgi:hypothetical protein
MASGCVFPFITNLGKGPKTGFVPDPAVPKNKTLSVSGSNRSPGSTTMIGPYRPLPICIASLKCVWYMNEPARGGVQRTVSESPGAMAGRIDLPDPLHPGTPSG